MGSEDLERMAFDAEDAGADVYIQRYGDTDVIQLIEINGEEVENPEWEEELREDSDGWRGVAEGLWRQ